MDPAGAAAAGGGDAGAAGSGFQFSVPGSQFSVFCAVNSFLEIYLRSLAGTRATVLGIGDESGIPPSPRSIGIIGLERKCDLIYGARSLTGKILMSKNLQAKILLAEAQNGTMRVSAYRRCLDHDYAIYFWAQGQMSQRGCGKVKML